MKLYHGVRGLRGAYVMVSDDIGDRMALDPRSDLLRHSPTGYEWGYEGSGPAQLAFALLADAVDAEVALCRYMEYKHDVIASLPGAPASGRFGRCWTLTQVEIQAWAVVRPLTPDQRAAAKESIELAQELSRGRR